MTLDAHVVVRRAEHTVDVRLEAGEGEVLALVGPNGSGKSTVVRALAGLESLSAGHVQVGGSLWEGGGSRLDPGRRRVGLVFQDQLLFPHLTALGNVAFGPRARGVSRRESERRAAELLQQLGVGELAGRHPAELSGGEAQRVAIARALATDPELLLLDEPFAALDVGVSTTLRRELAAALQAFQGTCVLVTHDAVDALMLADRVVVIEDGHVAQAGTPHEVTRRPRTAHAARMLGMNLLTGFSAGTSVRLPDGSDLVTAAFHRGEVQACFPPSAVTVSDTEPTGSARNRWHGPVMSAVTHGSAVRVHIDVAGGLIADVTPRSAAQLALRDGTLVWATVKATEIEVYGADSGSSA